MFMITGIDYQDSNLKLKELLKPKEIKLPTLPNFSPSPYYLSSN